MTKDPDNLFDLSYLARTNTHIEVLNQVNQLLNTTYRVKARFEYQGFNGCNIWCNGQQLVTRPGKFKPFTLGLDVTLLDHNLKGSGGSNHYPSVAFKGAYCELEFTSYGLPQVEINNGWSIHIYSLTPLFTTT